MNLQSLKQDLEAVLKQRELSQIEFATRHGLSYSWINKLLNDVADNPRLNSINDLQAAIEKERGQLAC
jgi:transcriptional regulator with XRE-family HTH domain